MRVSLSSPGAAAPHTASTRTGDGLVRALLSSAFAMTAAALCAALAAGALGLAVTGLKLPAGGGILLAMTVAGTVGAVLAARVVKSTALVARQPLDALAQRAAHDPADLPSGAAGVGTADLAAEVGRLVLDERRRAREHRELAAEVDAMRQATSQHDQAQSQFLAKMSHELRTPLNAILGYAMLLHEDATDAGNAAVAADLDRIQAAGRNLLGVINDILDLAKLDTDKAAVARCVFGVGELVEEIAALCPSDQRNGNRLEIAVDPGVGIMIGDRAKVRQCLHNLLKNAFKFTRDGTVKLTVKPISASDRNAIEFVVSDTGIGIAQEQLGDLFEAFHQVDRGANRGYGGAGLGLAITRRLARVMGGECTVLSQPGNGSTFTLSLPLSPITDGRAAPEPPGQAAPRPLPVRRSDLCALIIDDDEAAIDLMQRWLERIGYDVYSAVEGELGLALFREHRPSLVLLDALMPGRSGYEVLEEMRADPELGSTPIFLITVDDDRARGLGVGATDYLRKPVTARQLAAVTEVYRGEPAGEILVIDDDDDAADLIKRTVEPAGFSIRRASDGAEGIAMASSTRPAAIVLDLAMPGLDGFGVLEHLATDDALKDVPLIVLSGRELSLAQHRLIANAGHRFFTKGMSTPREIAASLREMVA